MAGLRSHNKGVIGIDSKTGFDINEHSLAELCEQVDKADVVIHLASTCSTPGSVRDPLRTFDDTVQTAARVLEACRLERKPIIVTSSVKARDGKTPYGAAKRMVELWAKEYGTAYNFPVVINRPGTIYGPGQEGSEDSGWIAWFCKARDEGIPVVINGDGQQRRDLLHVKDYASLLLLQAQNPGRYVGRIWDVGGGLDNAVTVKGMADWLELKYSHGPERYGDATEYVGLNNVPGWSPTVRWWMSETLG